MELQALIAGGLSGALAEVVVAPFDRLKIKHQYSGSPFRWTTIWQTFREIQRTQGALALWRGLPVSLARIVPYSATIFGTFGAYSAQLPDNLPGHQRNLIAGGLAGLSACVLWYPLDLIRARAALCNTTCFSYLHMCKSLWQSQGMLGFYQGLSLSLCGVFPYTALTFGIYETFKGDSMNSAQKAGLGGVAALVAQSLTYPVDTMRRRMQSGRYSSIRELLGHMWGENPRSVFLRGITINWVRGPISLGISFSANDKLKAYN